MIRTVTALFDGNQEAERALERLSARVPIMKGAIVTCAPGERPDFGSLYLSRGQREACEAELAEGGSLVIAQVEGNAAAEQAVDLLDQVAQRQAEPAAAPPPVTPESAPEPALFSRPRVAPGSAGVVPGVPITTSSRRAVAEPIEPEAAMPAETALSLSPEPEPEPEPQAEERIPLIEEALRVGKKSVMRGGARVHSYMEEVPVSEEIELIEERTSVERRPVGRLISEEEIAASGLLQDRVVEVAAMREEAVLSKEAVVREELVVKKTVERRIEQVQDTVRRTAVEVERLEPELAERGRTG